MSLEEKANPYPLLLPDSLVLGQLVAAMGVFIKATAWELGERFDAILGHTHGPDWLVHTYGSHQPPNLHDPDFVFYWHPIESILWEALPPFTEDLKARFGKARLTRNRWEHQAALQTTNTFLNGVDHINRLAKPLGLKTSTYAPELIKRIQLLQAAGGVLPPSQSELELEMQKEAAEEAQAMAEAAVSAAEAAVAEAEAHGAKAVQALAEQRMAQEEVATAKAEIELLEAKLLQAGRMTRQSLVEQADALSPGEPWGDIPLGIRVLTLKANMVDLMDLTTQSLLSQQIGPLAIDAATRWLQFMPNGGQVHLTPAGHAAANVGGGYIYLGRLDES